ncbi:16111_t:CDS:1, partial [Racocetra fulgida]
QSENEAQQIHNNLYIYLLDLDREEPKNITLNLYIPGDDFKQKLAHICGAITQIQKRTHSNGTILELFFKLGQLLETQNWQPSARRELYSYFSPRKARNVWKIAQRTHQLFNIR